MQRSCVAVLAVVVSLVPLPVSAAGLVIGVPAWPSAEVTAHIIADTLHDKYGVDADLQERGTLTILADIGRGRIQVHPEIWLPNLNVMVDKLSKQDNVLRLGPHTVAASQNICVTNETAQQTGVKAVGDLAKAEIAAKFDSDGDGMGEMWIGAPTWSSTEIERIRARSYGYDKTMTLLEMPEDVAMASVDAAVAVGRPIVFYCYGPHHVFALHDIVRLEEPPHDPARWSIVTRAQDDKWLEKSKADTAWGASSFQVGYAASLEKDMPEVAAFLSAMEFQPEDVTEMSYAVVVEGKAPEEVARSWMSENADRIGEWTK
ncbi:amino acid-binding protein [Rhodobacterales bacterium]|nr:amino acid-binding protein [Rhodobacterales bacterium]